MRSTRKCTFYIFFYFGRTIQNIGFNFFIKSFISFVMFFTVFRNIEIQKTVNVENMLINEI